jgi:transcription antitermination factor NusG
MPILPDEPVVYPVDLWTRPGGPKSGQPWWCLHTKPRQEKSVARDLRERRLTFYLPVVVQESRTPTGRKIRSRVPLFTSYVFFQGDDEQRRSALTTNRLVQTLPVPDPNGLVADLRQIDQMLRSGLPVMPEPIHPVGARVQIASGPLAGMIGIVIRRGQSDRFVAIVQFLGSGASADLRDWQVERVET